MSDQMFDEYKTIKVLIAEDRLEDAELIKRKLEKNGFTLNYRIVDDEERFITALKMFNPDLILSDYVMPSFTGLEALSIAQMLCPEVPFIFITGAIGEEIAAETILNGASGLILKSNLDKLPALVLKALGKQDRWYSDRAMNTSKRIDKRIKGNLAVLERIKNFLEIKTNKDEDLPKITVASIKKLIENNEDTKNS